MEMQKKGKMDSLVEIAYLVLQALFLSGITSWTSTQQLYSNECSCFSGVFKTSLNYK